MNSKSLVRHLSSITAKLDSKVAALPSNPKEETIHDLRTTTRRFEAYTELLPKDIRKKHKVTIYRARARTLFKATTPIRDIDIVHSKLSKFNQLPEIKQILQEKKRTRRSLLKEACMAADRLKKTQTPRFKTNQISQSKLLKRKIKVLQRYQSLLERQLKFLFATPTTEQLHDFRKNCKMLRYTLEVIAGKKDPFVSNVGKIQGHLGVVMDVQATLSALSRFSNGGLGTITDELNAEKEKAMADCLEILPEFASSLARLSPTETSSRLFCQE